MSKLIVLLCSVMMVAGAAMVNAAGFGIYEEGAAALAQAGAFAGRADDATAVYYNPAGITQLKGTHLSIGTTIITTKASFHDSYRMETFEAKSQTFAPSTLYLTTSLTDQVAFGFGFFSRFGLGMNWGDEYPYRYEIISADIATYSLNPVLAFKVSDNFSFAAGLEYMLGNVELKQAIDTTALEQGIYYATGMSIDLPDGLSTLKADNGSGDFGFNLGMQAKLADKFRLGLTYRSKVKVKFDGDLKVSGLIPSAYGSAIDAIIAANLPASSGDVTITMPQMAQVGLGMDVTNAFQLEFDVCWVDWSSYNELRVNLDKYPALVSDKDWRAAYCYRLGGQYSICDCFKLRAGYLYDSNPVPDRTLDLTLPDYNRHSVQLGAGFAMSDFTVDLTYMYLLFEKRTLNDVNDNYLVGSFKSSANLIGLQLGYKF